MASVAHKWIYEVRLGEIAVGVAGLELECDGGEARYLHGIDLTIGGIRARRREEGKATGDFALIEETATVQTGAEPAVTIRAVAGPEGLVRGDGALIRHPGPLVCSALLSRFGAVRQGGRCDAVQASLVSAVNWRIIHTVLVPSRAVIPPEAVTLAAGRDILAMRHSTDTATITTFALGDGEVLVEEVSNGLRILQRPQ